uniref:Uncharacterized protein n=1 Tax=Glycine max TaxID=3847 RepID=A0A0R0KDJ9_SOYBN
MHININRKMNSSDITTVEKPHAVCIPYPGQGHITPMLKLAKLLHFKGFQIPLVNTEFNHKRLLKSQGPDSLNGFPSFRFETIPDGLPESDEEDTHLPFEPPCQTQRLLTRPSFSDRVMSFTLIAAKELGIPEAFFWTISARGLLCYLHHGQLIKNGLIPLKESTDITNGYLETAIDWLPGEDFGRAKYASAIILNTLEALQHDVLEPFSFILPPVYPIGPLTLLLSHVTDEDLNTIGSNLWKEDRDSVVYVNFGSITVMASDQLIEFARGLANSGKTFLWVIRPDLVDGENMVLPYELCQRLKIEQPTNCRFCCKEWGAGMQIEGDVTRDRVERFVRELMEGQKGEELTKKALEWKKLAEDATIHKDGSSFLNYHNMFRQVLLSDNNRNQLKTSSVWGLDFI